MSVAEAIWVQKIFRVVLWLLYPLLIFVGLQVLQPRYVALALLLVLLLRHAGDAARLAAGLSKANWLVFASVGGLIVGTILTNNEMLLKLYPAIVSLGMLVLFGASLRHPPTMIERFARLREPALSPAGVRYTRAVTQVWCGFFVCNGLVAAYTALWADRRVWALYNGLIAYGLMAVLFMGEWLVRRRFVARAAS